MGDDSATLTAVTAFNDAFNRHDVDAVMATVTADCVFESTTPPEGVRFSGADAVRTAFTDFFASSPTARFETEEAIVAGDRCVVRWRYTWGDGSTPGRDADSGSVRGVDVLTVRDGKVAEKLAYVKG
jgi:ketosteroid isomerase-like protein